MPCAGLEERRAQGQVQEAEGAGGRLPHAEPGQGRPRPEVRGDATWSGATVAGILSFRYMVRALLRNTFSLLAYAVVSLLT